MILIDASDLVFIYQSCEVAFFGAFAYNLALFHWNFMRKRLSALLLVAGIFCGIFGLVVLIDISDTDIRSVEDPNIFDVDVRLGTVKKRIGMAGWHRDLRIDVDRLRELAILDRSRIWDMVLLVSVHRLQ